MSWRSCSNKGIIKRSKMEGPLQLRAMKKNGKTRIIVDYREFYKYKLRFSHPSPWLEDQLKGLQEATKYTIIDLSKSYYQIPIEEEHTYETGFINQKHLENLKMPLGLSKTHKTFQDFHKPFVHLSMVRIYWRTFLSIARHQKNMRKTFMKSYQS